MTLHWKDILSSSLILFSVIDILGSIPVVVDLRKKAGHIQSGKATIVAGVIMILFLFLGESLLHLFGIDVNSFAIAGGIVIFILGLEMVLGITFFKTESMDASSASVVPIAFPLIAGAGTMTTLLTLRAEYAQLDIIVGILINLLIVFLVLKTSKWLEDKLGPAGFNILRKVFGVILLAIAVKLLKSNL